MIENQSTENADVRITVINVKNKIVLSFDKPIEYIVMSKNRAMDIGSKLREKASKTDGRL